MIDLSSAFQFLRDEPTESRVERVPLQEASLRVLGEDVLADRDDPPFDRSAMDGFAFRGEWGSGKEFNVVGTVAAGDAPWTRSLGEGEAAAIMTGAPIPPGADQVIPVEQTRRDGDRMEIRQESRPGAHIRYQAEVVREGSKVLLKGQLITPERMGVLATVGRAHVPVFVKPRVGIASTGDELVPVDQVPAPGQIRDSNRWVLGALATSWGAQVHHLPRLGDSPEQVEEGLAMGLKSDILILSGGVSMGEFDWVDKTLRSLGVREVFHKVAMKPGKPVFVGRIGKTWVFGLPGNPVSAAVTARLFVRTIVGRMLGVDHPEPVREAFPLNGDLKQVSHRSTFVPGRWTTISGQRWVEPVQTSGSGDAIHHADSNVLIFREAGSPKASHGALVDVWVTGI